MVKECYGLIILLLNLVIFVGNLIVICFLD